MAIVTCHFDQNITIINRGTDQTWEVQVNNDVEVDGTFTQSHLNWVSPDGLYFYLFATESGDFVEVDLKNKVVSRTWHTGGSPEQSTS